MEKSQLGIAGLVAGVIGLIIGIVGIMNASSAANVAAEAEAIAEQAISPEDVDTAVKLAVAKALKANEAEMARLVKEAEKRVEKLMENSDRIDILSLAKEDTLKMSRELRRELQNGKRINGDAVDTLREDMNTMLRDVKLEQKAEFQRFQKTILRQIQRWQESGIR